MASRCPLARAALVSLLVLVAACGDEPSAPRRLTPVRACFADEQPWVAYRNEGASWTRVAPRDGVFSFDASERVALALAFGDRALPYLVVEYMSAEQARVAHPCGTVPATPAPIVASGVLRPWSGQAQVQIAYGGRSWFHFGADSVFGLPAVDGTSDLVAVRGSWANDPYADRMIVRRAQAYAAGARAVLDFGADEAFAPEARSLRFDGPLTGIEVRYRTASGVEAMVHGASVGQSGDPVLPRATTIYAVPDSRLVAGDLHRVLLEDFDSADRRRAVELWTRAARDLAMRFGPVPPPPTFRALATAPVRRIAAEIPSQPDYDASVMLSLYQNAPANTSMNIRATREYFGGTPAVWLLEVPDLAAVDGYPRGTALEAGPFTWSLALTSRPGFFFIPTGPPQDGQVTRSATISGLQP